MQHVKIVATIGPSVRTKPMIRRMIEAGLDVARLNFSHGDYATHAESVRLIREASAETGQVVAILADLSGPKIRLGELLSETMTLTVGQTVTLTSEPKQQDPYELPINYKHLAEEVRAGESILLDDGKLELIVERIELPSRIICTVKVGGPIKSRKGLNSTSAGSSIPALTHKDREDIVFAKQLGVDFFALSFVRRAEDIVLAKQIIGDIPVIAKIEKPAAIERLEEIADEADGAMVARGDLGVEVGFEKVPLLQKQIISAMNRRAKPVITATQMLESMINAPIPTRAEVSDVANAVLDGTDAVMLSAETASGQYPIEAISAMNKIIAGVETDMVQQNRLNRPASIDGANFQNAVAHSAAQAAIALNLKAVVVFSETGRSLALVSAYRPPCPIVGFCPDERVLRRFAGSFGVLPNLGQWATSTSEVVALAEATLLKHNLAAPGDEIAITYGMGDTPHAATSMLKLWKVRKP